MMKKCILALAACLTLSAGAAFASPINNLATGQTALGFGSDTVYVEHKFSDVTLGYQSNDWDDGDIYGQFDLSENMRGIIGSKNFDSDSKMYLGLAVHGPMSDSWDGYASFIAGNEFKQIKFGVNHPIANNVDLNLDYHSYMPDAGNKKSGVGVGATFKL